jgi:uncharacterized repeat protein (TIGR02059 family)
MRKVLFFVCLFVTLSANATTFYVATNGNDNNPGTIGSPFLTWGKLSSVMIAGDIAYIRGGTYRSPYSASATKHVGLYSLTGTASNIIKIVAYPGEKPVLNLDNITPSGSYCFGFFMQDCNYVYVSGLRITGLAQASNGNSITGMYIANSPNCVFEQCEVDNIGGYGIALGDGSNNIVFKNCDVHHCSDRYTAFENANGFMVTGGSTATNITYDGCRAWNCSDDGWDFFGTDGNFTINNCWSFWNGYDDSFNFLGDGQGFKLGPTASNKSDTHIRTITRSIAAKNSHNGFDQNSTSYSGIQYFFNNTAYDNGKVGFSFNYLNGISNIFKNNISFGNDGGDGFFGTGTIQSNNSWIGGPVATSNDFESVDLFLLNSPRQADGSLPDIPFLHLKSGSALIDAGIDVGLPYIGIRPDLGAFEFQSGPVVYVPVYVSSVVANSSPSVVTLTYSYTLANIIPNVSAFTVRVNSTLRSVSSVAISGATVALTLSSPIIYGDAVAVSYTKPTTNPIQTASGGQAVSITSQVVTNNVSAVAVVSPVYSSSVISNTTPSLLEISYNMTLANVVPSVTAFSVKVNSVSRTVNTVTLSGNKVLLALSSQIYYGDIVTVSYIKPAVNPIQSSSGGQAAAIASQIVTNNVSATDISYVSSTIENSSPALLVITFSSSLAGTIPSSAAFSVSVNSTVRAVNSVAISNTTAILTLAKPVIYGDAITISYTKPANNQLQSSAGIQVVSFGPFLVSNKVNPLVPVYNTSVIENANPSLLVMTYSLAPSHLLPPASSFTVYVNLISRTVTNVSSSGDKVALTLSSRVVFGDFVTVAYTKPSINPLKTDAGGLAESLTAQPVINNCLKQTASSGGLKVLFYPNPAHNYINISIQEVTLSAKVLRIFDSSGNLVKIENLKSGISEINFPLALTPGYYTIVLEEGGYKLTSQKIIII